MLGFTGVNLPEDPRDIEAVFIGEQPCDLINATNNEPYGTYTKEHTNSFLWIRCLPRQLTPGVYNVSVGVSDGTEGKAWRHSNSRYYGPGGRLIMLEVFPGEEHRIASFLLLRILTLLAQDLSHIVLSWVFLVRHSFCAAICQPSPWRRTDFHYWSWAKLWCGSGHRRCPV